jgi:putative DNA primase/helicase
MRRRAPGETVERIRRDGLLRRLDPLRRRAARWVADHLAALQAADPTVPDALQDRQADNWRALLAIADAAGGGWGDRARVAARTLAGAGGEADPAVPVQLLADLRDLFATSAADRLATAAIIHHLIRLEERSWAEYAAGRPLTPRHLAQLLEGFRIKAKQIRQGAATRKGYLRSDFTDAFRRYLPPVPSESGTAGGCGGVRGSAARQAEFR